MKIFNKMYNLTKSKVFISFLFYYIFVIILMSLAGIMSYRISTSAIEKELSSYNLSLMELIKQTMDKRFSEINNFSYQISVNTKVNRLLNSKKPLSIDNRLDIVNLQLDLKSFSVINEFVDEYFIYFTDLDTIITSSSKYNPGDYFKDSSLYSEINYEKWYKEILNSKNTIDYIPLTRVKLYRLWKNVITYSSAIPPHRIQKGKVVFIINENQISDLIKQNEYYENSLFYIMDSDRNVIFTSDYSEDIPLIYPENKAVTYYRYNNVDSIIVSIKSDINNWTYNMVISRDVFFHKVEKIKNVFILIEIIAILTGIIMSVFLAYRNYIPISDIIASIKQNKGDSSNNKINKEYKYIKDSVLFAFNEANNLKSMVESYKHIMRTNFFIRLLNGEKSESTDWEKESVLLDINRDNNLFSISLFHIKADISVLNECTKNLDNIINEQTLLVFDKKAKSYWVEIQTGRYILILLMEKDSMNNIDYSIEMFIAGIKNHISSCKDVAVDFSRGPLIESITDIKYSMDYAMGNMSSNFNNEDDIYYYPTGLEMQLVNMILSCNFEDALNTLNELYRINLDEKRLSSKMTQYFFFSVVNTVIGIIYEKKLSIEYNPLTRLSDCHETDAMKKYTHNLIAETIKKLKSIINHNNSKEKDEIVDFITSNYYDFNMSLELISDHFKMSKSKVCRILKEQTNEGYVDFISKFRLGKAKKLLLESHMLNSEIAEKTGFQNYNSFMRIFKKYTGITPGQYRDNYKIKITDN